MSKMFNINKIINKDITIKIIAVMGAFLIWVFVLNSQNPYSERKIEISLSSINIDTLAEKDIVLINREDIPRSVQITIRGRSSVIEKYTSSDFYAQLDFSKIHSVRDIQLKVEGPFYDGRNVNVARIEPNNVDLSLEQVVKRTFPIEIRYSGDLRSGYRILNMTHTPSEFELVGLESIIDRVNNIQGIINIDNVEHDLNVNESCTVYDIFGSELEGFQDITVNIDIVIAKEVQVKPNVTGNPNGEFVEGLRSVNPQRILITGPSDMLSSIEHIYTEQVDIEGIDGNLTKKVNFDLPEGLIIVSEEKEAEVTVRVESLITRIFNLRNNSVKLLNMNGSASYNYELLDNNYSVTVKGRREEINMLTENDISLDVDVSEFDEGVHGIPAQVILPQLFGVIESDSVRVRIQKNKSVNINTENISILNKQEGLTYTIESHTKELMLKGYTTDLNKVNSSDLMLEYSGADLTPGIHNITIDLSLPSGVSLAGANPELTIVVEEEIEETETDI